MTRLFVLLLCALGLAFAPVAASAAASVGTMPGCTMGSDMPMKSGDQSKMDCCTPACQAPSSAAFLPSRDETPSIARRDPVEMAWVPAKELASVPSSGLDPPPRG